MKENYRKKSFVWRKICAKDWENIICVEQRWVIGKYLRSKLGIKKKVIRKNVGKIADKKSKYKKGIKEMYQRISILRRMCAEERRVEKTYWKCNTLGLKKKKIRKRLKIDWFCWF